MPNRSEVPQLSAGPSPYEAELLALGFKRLSQPGPRGETVYSLVDPATKTNLVVLYKGFQYYHELLDGRPNYDVSYMDFCVDSFQPIRETIEVHRGNAAK